MYLYLYARPASTQPRRRFLAPSAGGIQMLRNRLTASSGEPGSSQSTALATTHIQLEAAIHHPVKDGRPGRNSRTDVRGRNRTPTGLIYGKSIYIEYNFPFQLNSEG